MKKVKTSWSSCPLCDVVVSDRFLKRHEKDQHQSGEGWNNLESSRSPVTDDAEKTPSRAHVGDALGSSLLGSTLEYGFFSKGTLYAVITTTKLLSEPELPKTVKEQIVFLSPGTMRVGHIGIGDHIAINDKYCYKAWPDSSVPDCHVCIQTKARVRCGKDVLPAGSLCAITSLSNSLPARSVKVTIQEGFSVLPNSVKPEDLMSFIKQQLYMRMVSAGCALNVSYFGRPINVRIAEVAAQEGAPCLDNDSLCEDMSHLNLSLVTSAADSAADESASDTAQLTSTPVSVRSRSTTVYTPALRQLENGLKATTGRFYQMCADTAVTLTDQVPAGGDTAQDDDGMAVQVVAGVDGLLDTLNQLIVEPISKKAIYRQYGVGVPRGVLLHGPSGCGKTLIAATIGRQLRGHAEFITLNSSQLWSKQFGETESRIQQIFQQAIDNSPSVLFIDDIDVMCPRRERSQSDLEKRVLSSLVTEIDKVARDGSSYVFILATTNRLDAVDMTLRRPGRIDRELEVPVPSSVQRKQIISALLTTMLHSISEQDVVDIAADCHGYVGADLQNLCREAGLSAIRSNAAGGISRADFSHAMSVVQPSAMREIYIDIPKVRWTDIGGQEHLKQSLVQAIVWPLQHADKFKRLGIKPPRGVLMYGPPGCSKTMIAKALATETSLNFISIKGPELFSKWVGESEKTVREIFRKARSAAPSIVFFDEIDAIAVERGSQQGGGGGVGDRVLAQLLTELDGVEGLNNVNIVAATNRPDMIDKALLRPGRLDRLVYVPLPDQKTRDQIFRLRLTAVPLADDVSYEELVRETHMFSGAEAVAVCNEAALSAMQENLEAELIERAHFLKAIGSIKPQTTESMVKYYEDYSSGSKR